MRKTGLYKLLGSTSYFIPDSLPPQNPSLALNSELLQEYELALVALSRLSEMSQRLPDKQRFIKAYVVKEALLSSEIENIHTTLLDVFTHTLNSGSTNKDTTLVVNYTQALEVALEMIQKNNMPLTSRVLFAAHHALMEGGVGSSASPGQFRKQSVQVGNLVPPPATEIAQLINNLEQYMNAEHDELPKLIKAGLVHVQFETIHPFLDGNGRIGRLLIVLMLMQDGLLQAPVLYPSYYFKKHHHEYYVRLDRVRTHGDFEGWILFYLQTVRASSQDAYTRVQNIEALEQKIKNQILTAPIFAQTSDVAIRALSIIFTMPVIDVTTLSKQMSCSYNTAQKFLHQFQELNIVSLVTSQKRNKLYQFNAYLDVLNAEY